MIDPTASGGGGMDNSIETEDTYAAIYKEVRKKVFACWRGPVSLEASNIAGRHFSGWPFISLDVRIGWPHRIESRSVYLDVRDESQKFAVLRAVSWDAMSIHASLREQREDFEFAIPARFVQIEAEKARFWADLLEGSAVFVSDINSRDQDIPIKRFRIEWDPISSAFEQVWQGADQHHETIDGWWSAIWSEMTECLMTSPAIDEFKEHFRSAALDVSYNSMLYEPVSIEA